MIFNGEMVRAILEGRKTQTRRIMKVQPVLNGSFYEVYGAGWGRSMKSVPAIPGHSLASNCPFGLVGDRIWVRETWAEAGASAPDLKLYRANYPAHVPTHYENIPPADEIRWTPSIHMPRWASRLTLEITGVRVERLRDLSEDDAKSEGITPPSGGVLPGWEYRINFRDLWMSIYGADNWETNPWVWVIEFKVVPNVQDNPA